MLHILDGIGRVFRLVFSIGITNEDFSLKAGEHVGLLTIIFKFDGIGWVFRLILLICNYVLGWILTFQTTVNSSNIRIYCSGWRSFNLP